jgi:hypothetical protein
MAKKSFIHRISKRLGEPEEIKPEDVDREVAAAVRAIKAEKTETLDGTEVLNDNWGEAGDKAYVMDLAPIYEIIGGRKGRMAENLRESCKKEFAGNCVKDCGCSSLEGDLFLMRFYGLDEKRGFVKAATIVNTVCIGLLGSRFEALKVPSLLIAADVGEITNGDGSVNMDGLLAAVEAGGSPVSLDEPGSDAPQWVKMRWRKEARDLEMRKMKIKAKPKPQAHPIRTSENKIKRSNTERRKSIIHFKSGDRRKSFDRRGRGH